MKAELIRPILSIEEWLSDYFYVGPEVDFIRPYVRKFLIEYGNSKEKRNFLCTGAARTGKSYAARLLLQRILYEVSCWKNFPCLFGLSPSTIPKFYWLSYTYAKADSTGLKGLMRMMDKVPYWNLPENRRKDVDSSIILPFCEVHTGSNVTHIIGEDMLGCILDEANVRKVAKGTEVEETQRMFTEMKQRSVMTFSRNGIWGGFSGIISSTTTSSSFVAKELEKARKNNDTVIMEASVYEANPEQYSKEKFKVFIGDGTIPSFIVDSVDASISAQINSTYGMTVDQFIKSNDTLIENVPVSIRKFYEDDLEYSLANMSGKSMRGNSKWLSPKLIKTIWNDDRRPMDTEVINIGIYDDVDWEELLDESYVTSLYHGERCYCHVDFGQKHDHTGISILYYDREDHHIRSMFTQDCKVDLTKDGNMADQTKVWELILLLRSWGVNIPLVTGDIWAKSYLIPQANMVDGMKGEYYSVDTDNMAAYLTMQRYMKVGMYSIPYYGQLETELSELIRDGNTGIIDHMENPNGREPVHFKDLVDAFAGASFHLFTREDVSYDELVIQRGREAVHEHVPDDGFFSSISHEDEDTYEDEMELFRKGLYGLENEYVPLKELE